MRRLPLIPTLIVGAAIALMIALGIWQLQRAEWKEQVIAEANAQIRPVEVTCNAAAEPEARAGRSRDGEIGYRYLAPCGEGGIRLDIGWSKRPDALERAVLNGRYRGMREPGPGGIVVLERPLPPLAPSGLPTAASIPNNHFSYAVQWFLFALAAGVIYILALRRRKLPPGA